MAMAADSMHMTWLGDGKVVRTQRVAAVTAQAVTGQSHFEVSNPRRRLQAVQTCRGESPHDLHLKRRLRLHASSARATSTTPDKVG
jgi:hypothetical protein